MRRQTINLALVATLVVAGSSRAADGNRVGGTGEGSHAYDPGPAGSGSAIAEYQPATGTIIVSVDGVRSWYIESIPLAPVFDGPDDANSVLPLGGGLVTDHDFRIGEVNLGFVFSYTDANLGRIAQTGLPVGSLHIFYVADLGTPIEEGVVTFADVPEPTGMPLIALGLVSFLARRRRT